MARKCARSCRSSVARAPSPASAEARYSRASVGAAPYDPERPAHAKAEALIERDRRGVVRKDVQERHLAAGGDLARQPDHKRGRKAAATRFRVGANRAQFGVGAALADP